MKIRKALIKDIPDIVSLVNDFARKDEMLPRTTYDIIENIRNFMVIEESDGEIIACGALCVTWTDIAEIRSLAVKPEYQSRGVGKEIVERLIEDSVELGIFKIFALTYKPGFFKKLGFEIINKDELPKKVWTDCIKCSKFPDCDEIAVITTIKKMHN